MLSRNAEASQGNAQNFVLAVSSLLLAFMANPACSQNVELPEEYVQTVRDFAAQNIALAIVLADANLITLGVMDFDPNELVDFGDLEVGNAESLKQRSQRSTYSIPWSLPSRNLSGQLSQQFQLRLSYVAADQDIVFDNASFPNAFEEQTYMLFGESTWRYKINQQWTLHAGLGAQLVHYNNDFDYADPEIEPLSYILDDTLFNTSFTALLADPTFGASYRGEVLGQTWQYKLNYRYAIGHTIDTNSHSQDTDIETGRLSNTLVYHYDTANVLNRRSQIRLLASRIDVGGDAVSPMGAHHYYEVGAGWLIDTSNDIRLLNNVGIGLALNIGSNLSGGSLVILFNEEM